jgi:hypothetical protein
MHFIVCLLMTVAANAAQNDQSVIEVFLPTVTNLNLDQAFQRARLVVTETYAEIGVRVVWRSAASTPSACLQEPRRRRIVVALRASTPPGMPTETAAFAKPYATKGPCVTLLMDQIEPAVRLNPLSSGFLLGYVLAHEIGHVVQGVARHSETGVMKNRWSLLEVVNMKYDRLHFTALDATLILEGCKSPN